MKLSETIKVLQDLQAHLDGLDPDLLISVRDYYTVYGYDARIEIGRDPGQPWEGTTTNRDAQITRLHVSLFPREGKSPKITFRK